MNSSRVDPSLCCKPLRIGSESIYVLGCKLTDRQLAVAAPWDRKQERNHCRTRVVSRDTSAEHGRHCGRNQQCITFWQSFSAKSISLCGNYLDCFLTAHTQACTADARGGVTQGTSEHVTQCFRDTEAYTAPEPVVSMTSLLLKQGTCPDQPTCCKYSLNGCLHRHDALTERFWLVGCKSSVN